MSKQPLLSVSDNTSDRGSGSMYTKINERSELEKFRNQHESNELADMVDRYESIWRPAFEKNMAQEYPKHPWKILKQERKRYAEEENDGKWPSMPKRHALRVVKDEYKEKWENYSAEFNSSEQS